MLTTLLSFFARAVLGVHRRIGTFSIRRALSRRGLNGVSKIQTYTHLSELEALFKLARGCRSDARVLEIGSYLGASTCYLAAGLSGPAASITCIDTWQNQTMPDGIRDTLEEFEKNLRSVRSQLTLIRKASSEVTSSELSGPFDLIFLDGDHSYEQTLADFRLVSDLVAPKGVLAFHDALFFEGVSQVVGEALASGRWQIGGLVRNLLWLRPARFNERSRTAHAIAAAR